MPGGKRNLLSMSHMIESLGDAVHNAKDSAHAKKGSLSKKLSERGIEIPLVDLQIQFIGASGLPKMDVVGTSDPYFVANLDKELSFVSNVKSNTISPVWNEIWRVKNVPTTADLHIEILDKDEGSATDDFIGKFTTSVTTGAKEIEIEGPLLRRSPRGTFWLKIDSAPSTSRQRDEFQYLFDGPVRFTRHFSPTVGRLTSSVTSSAASTSEPTSRLYSTWKIYIKGVPLFFRDVCQPWNRKYPAAQKIFQGTTSLAVRSGIQAGHKMLYARLAKNGFGVLDDNASIRDVLHGGARGANSSNLARPSGGGAAATGGGEEVTTDSERIKPAVYTYIISSDDDSFRFSETGAAFFVDFASKHALHSNCAETVRYSGEFHPRPVGGWAAFNDSTPDNAVGWELVIDNNSGTYAPDKMMLPTLQECLEYNFHGFGIIALDHEDERLKESREACREYALKYRGIGKDELQPHVKAGEMTLSQEVEAGVKQAARAAAETPA